MSPFSSDVVPSACRSHPNSAICFFIPSSCFLPFLPEILISQGFVNLAAHPQPMQQDAQFSCNSHNCFLLSAFATTFGQAQAPTFQVGIGSATADDVVRSLHQHRPQIRIAFLRDSQLRLTLARIAAPWPQPNVTADIATLLESVFICHSEYEGQSDQ